MTIHDYFFGEYGEHLTPLPYLPNVTDVGNFHTKSQVFLDALPDLHDIYYTEKHWVCAYCRTHTNLLTYKKNENKS